MSEYRVALEVAGLAAMLARPDTGSTPITYPAPILSAAWIHHQYSLCQCLDTRLEEFVTFSLRRGQEGRIMR